MKSIKFEGCNKTFGPPKGMTNEECYTVHACQTEDGRVITAWIPTKTEIENIRDGGAIYLSCLGGMPPVCIFTLMKNDMPSFTDNDVEGVLGDEETLWINHHKYLADYRLGDIRAREYKTEKEFIHAVEKHLTT